MIVRSQIQNVEIVFCRNTNKTACNKSLWLDSSTNLIHSESLMYRIIIFLLFIFHNFFLQISHFCNHTHFFLFFKKSITILSVHVQFLIPSQANSYNSHSHIISAIICKTSNAVKSFFFVQAIISANVSALSDKKLIIKIFLFIKNENQTPNLLFKG